MRRGRAEGMKTKEGPSQEGKPKRKEGIKGLLGSPLFAGKKEKNQQGKKDDIFFREEGGQVQEGGDRQAKQSPFLRENKQNKEKKVGEKKGKEDRTARDPGYVLKVSREDGKEQCARKRGRTPKTEPEKKEEEKQGIEDVKKDISQMEGGRIQAPDLKIQPVGEGRQRSIELAALAGSGTILVEPLHSAERTEQEALQESLAQDILVFADEVLIVPEKPPLHGRKENGQVKRQKEQDEDQKEAAGIGRLLGRRAGQRTFLDVHFLTKEGGSILSLPKETMMKSSGPLAVTPPTPADSMAVPQ